MKKLILLFALVFIIPSVAQAQLAWMQATGIACGALTKKGESCYVSIAPAVATDSAVINLGTITKWCFDSDTGAAWLVGDTGEGRIMQCVGVHAGVTPSVTSCEPISVDNDGNGSFDDGVLDGDPGSATGTQKRCIYDVGPGSYIWDNTAVASAGEDAHLEVTVTDD